MTSNALISYLLLGDCLRLINGREITWDNVDDVLLKISQLEEVHVNVHVYLRTQVPAINIRPAGLDFSMLVFLNTLYSITYFSL